MNLWEILVPTVRTDGRPYRTRYHRVWDAKVREITGGLTILPIAKGQWIAPDGTLFIERMIPVRIACTREQIEAIAAMTISHYDQQAVLAYQVGTEIIMRRRDEGKHAVVSAPPGATDMPPVPRADQIT